MWLGGATGESWSGRAGPAVAGRSPGRCRDAPVCRGRPRFRKRGSLAPPVGGGGGMEVGARPRGRWGPI